jgi:cytochrome P450
MSEEDLPDGIGLTPIDETYRLDPYPMLHKLREIAPAYRDNAFNRVHFTKNEDVARILRDKDFWSDPRKAKEGSFANMLLIMRSSGDEEPSMLLADDPDHKRLRNLVNKAFTPRAVENQRERTREIAEQLLDAVEGPEFDFMAKVAGPLPTTVIAEMLGVDPGRRDQFKAWSDASSEAFFNVTRPDDIVAAGLEANDSLDAMFREEIAKRREHPGDDLISSMVAAEEAGDKLTENEIVMQCNLLLIAGNVTTTDLIGNGLKALLDHPDQFALLKDDPTLIPEAVEEMLRYDSPVTYSGRIAHQDMTISGCPVDKGESLSTSLAAANRDPAAFEDPDTFDIMRKNKRHHSFGGGRHFCMGAPLARLEAQELFAVLIDRYPDIRMADREPVYRAIPAFRGMSEYWVRID